MDDFKIYTSKGACMKERVLVFSDAVIAIILTIIVLELPVEFFSDGTIKLSELLKTIGIYFISFCFVSNVWFQTAYAFNRVEKIKNKILIIYFILLFLLSLIPTATRLLIEDTTKQTIILYGILSLIVTFIMGRIIIALTEQAKINKDDKKIIIKAANNISRFTLFFRLFLIILSYFFIYPVLVIYLVLPIISFLQNMIDREEEKIIEGLHKDQQDAYLENRDNPWGGQINRYTNLLRNSFKDDSDSKNSYNWESLMKNWKENIDTEINKKETQLSSSTGKKQRQIKRELNQLYQQKKHLEERLSFINKNTLD